NIMDGVDINNLTIEQYLRLTQESHTPKKIEDMTIVEYLEYEKKIFLDYRVTLGFGSTDGLDLACPIIRLSSQYGIHRFITAVKLNRGLRDSNYDQLTDFASWQKRIRLYCQGTFQETLAEWIEGDFNEGSSKDHMGQARVNYLRLTQESHTPKKIEDMTIVEYLEYEKKGVENMEDALISIIKSIRQEMKDDIIKRQFKASTTSACDEVYSIASNKVDNANGSTSNIVPCRLPNELIP
nr:hypothetical protein [Tanacetum cinerariifolium]